MVTSTRRQTITCLSSRRWCYLIAIVVICLLVLWLPGPPQTQNNISPDRPSPKYQVTNTPRFLYRSPFRSHPDIGYEEHLSNSLRSIENSVLAQNHGNIIAEDRIWQIALGEARKGPDSAAFEQVNMDWAYSVRAFCEQMILLDNTERSKIAGHRQRSRRFCFSPIFSHPRYCHYIQILSSKCLTSRSPQIPSPLVLRRLLCRR